MSIPICHQCEAKRRERADREVVEYMREVASGTDPRIRPETVAAARAWLDRNAPSLR